MQKFGARLQAHAAVGPRGSHTERQLSFFVATGRTGNDKVEGIQNGTDDKCRAGTRPAPAVYARHG